MLKVVRIIARLNVGGPARHAVILDKGLRARGATTLLVHGRTAPSEGSLADLVRAGNLPEIWLPSLGRSVRPWDDLRALIRLTRLIFVERPDIVHTHASKGGALGRVAAAAYNATRGRGRRCLVVHTFHGNVLTGYFGPVGGALARLAERALGLLTDRVITISERQRQEIVARFEVVPARKAVVIPLGLDLNGLLRLQGRTGEYRRVLGFDSTALVFGYVGRLVAIKDPLTLVRAFALVSPQFPDARLLIAGDGELRAATEHAVRDLRVEGKVRFAGWQLDLPRLYDAIDVILLSSLNEGTPVSLIEAMAAGRPVVATRVGGVPDVVRQGETGLLVPPGDPAGMADAMRILGGDPEMRLRLGMAARREAAARFRAERLVDDVARLYTAALAEKRGR